MIEAWGRQVNGRDAHLILDLVEIEVTPHIFDVAITTTKRGIRYQINLSKDSLDELIENLLAAKKRLGNRKLLPLRKTG